MQAVGTVRALVDAVVFLMALVVLPTVVVCFEASRPVIVRRGKVANDERPGLARALLASILFLCVAVPMVVVINWRQQAYKHSVATTLASGEILLVPGWAQGALFAVIPSVFITVGVIRACRSMRACGSLGSLLMHGRFRPSPLVGLVLVCNVLALGLSLPSYAIFGLYDVFIRPWPYGLLAERRFSYDQVTAIIETTVRQLGRMGGALPLTDYRISFSTGFDWDTRFSADGSSDAERASALRLVRQRSGVVPKLRD